MGFIDQQAGKTGGNSFCGSSEAPASSGRATPRQKLIFGIYLLWWLFVRVGANSLVYMLLLAFGNLALLLSRVGTRLA